MEQIKILLTGSNSQISQCIVNHFPRDYFKIIPFTKEQLDITSKSNIEYYVKQIKPFFIINAAAYTNVDDAEVFPQKAFKINAEGVKNLSIICKKYTCTLIHFSTDYVFDGTKKEFTENDKPNPLNIYGKSKLLGETYIQDIIPNNHIILRTSWIFSKYGKNFLTFLQDKFLNEKHLKIVYDLINCPTNGIVLSKILFQLCYKFSSNKSGIYHYVQKSSTNKFTFATYYSTIYKKYINIKTKTIEPITFNQFKALNFNKKIAERPKISILNTNKIEKIFNIKTSLWKEFLK